MTGSDGITGIHVHPFFNYIWDPSKGIGGPSPFLAQEDQYIGGAIVQRPLTAAEYLWHKVITPKRPQAELVDQQSLPRLAEQTQLNKQLLGITTHADAARLRVRYVEKGIVVEEDFYTVIISYSIGSTLNYTPVEVYSLRAPQGQLDASSGLLYTLVRSSSIDRVWYANYLNIAQTAVEARRDEIRLAGEISRLLVNDANQIHESQMQEWTRQQTARDSIFDAAVDTILGVDDFRNPSTGEVEKLPGHYQHAWWGIDGSYVFTNDPNVDPRLGSNIDWFKLVRIAS